MKQVSFVIPLKDESALLSTNIKILIEYLATIHLDYEIILVENGSSDNTWQIANELATDNDKIQALSLDKPLFGQAIKEGLLVVKYDAIVLSIDLSMGLDFIERSATLLQNYDVVNGSRFLQKGDYQRSLLRKLFSSIYHPLASVLFGLNFTDYDGIKAIRKNIAHELGRACVSKHNFFFTEMLIIATRKQYSIIEIPIIHVDNRKSRFNITKLIFHQVYELVRVYFRSH